MHLKVKLSVLGINFYRCTSYKRKPFLNIPKILCLLFPKKSTFRKKFGWHLYGTVNETKSCGQFGENFFFSFYILSGIIKKFYSWECSIHFKYVLSIFSVCDIPNADVFFHRQIYPLRTLQIYVKILPNIVKLTVLR
jgi:hypothetical protein